LGCWQRVELVKPVNPHFPKWRPPG
jgi:hypothetical protein